MITIGDHDIDTSNLTPWNITFSLATYFVALNHSKFLNWAHTNLQPPIVHLADFVIWVMTVIGYIGLAILAIVGLITASVLVVALVGVIGWIIERVK